MGLSKAVCTIPANFLNDGGYIVNAFLLTDLTNMEVQGREVLSFTVHETGEVRREFGGQWTGVVRPKLTWFTQLAQRETGGTPR